jgi:hypothetical protein
VARDQPLGDRALDQRNEPAQSFLPEKEFDLDFPAWNRRRAQRVGTLIVGGGG